MIDGKYSGLGLSVVLDDGAVKVVSPFRGSPAEQVGIKAGDYITHLDGKLYYGGDLDEAGVYKLQAALTLGDWSGLGRTASFTVRPRFS